MSPSSYRTAFETAQKRSGVRCRFYDARHTFITRLAENPAISEETLSLAGQVSHRMLGRYVQIRAKARREAIATLEVKAQVAELSLEAGSPQNPHSRWPTPCPRTWELVAKPYQIKDLGLAPRAGFEPATRRLTAGRGAVFTDGTWWYSIRLQPFSPMGFLHFIPWASHDPEKH